MVGVGLNKTGTKTLRSYLESWGYKHITFDLASFEAYRRGDPGYLAQKMDEFDSFEDWPWPLLYKEFDQKYPDAKFILTTRKNPEKWFRSLCNMAIRIGPLKNFEKHIYGYSMPQGRKKEHLEFYQRHNQAVRDHFKDRPHKLLELSWDGGSTVEELAAFLQVDQPIPAPKWINKNVGKVYEGNNLLIAHLYRVGYQALRYVYRKIRY